jgi:uncharacterized membrane protein YoaK (UPF0700 family)
VRAPLERAVRAVTDAPSERLHVAIALTLTLGTGVIDAVSYVALDHVFTANMSGNMALLGVGVATDVSDVAGNAFAFAGFAIGSIAVARAMRARRHRSFLHTAADALLVQLTLLVALTAVMAAVDVSTDDAWRYAVCAVLATAMGIQTGVARHLAVADVNTTVATMTLHDLAAASRLAGGDSKRWPRRAGVVLALFVGAAAGVALDDAVRWGGLALSCTIVAAVAATAAALAAGSEPARVS